MPSTTNHPSASTRGRRLCHHCGTEIDKLDRVGRRDTCLKCGADLHCCLNCELHDPNYNNQCREIDAERQVDKQVGNFCDYFSFRSAGAAALSKKDEAREKLEALFGKKKS